MEFRILGPVEAWEDGRSLPLGGAKQRALLAILLTQANQVIAADRLIELIWPGEPPDTAAHSLQVYVSELRKVLEPKHRAGAPHAVLISQAPGYLIRVEGDGLDLNRFQRLVDKGKQSISNGAPESASAEFREALDIWRGPALADFAAQPFALSVVVRLNEAKLRALEDRIDADLALGRHADLVGELDSLVGQHPLRETFSRQLMLALYRSGRQAEASDVYQRARERLVEELGMEPGAEIQEMLKAILNQDAALDLEPNRVSRRRHNLPHHLTSFVGRTSEVSEVKRWLSEARLVTLTGTGGVGKTRLAIEVANQLADAYREGVWLVELASLRDPEGVPQSVASTLGVRDQAERTISDCLIDYLQSRQQLLLLDNCEHVIEAASQLVSLLLLNCPDLNVLATSREALSIGGEIAWRVPSLSLPNAKRKAGDSSWADNDSMALFVDRAVAAIGAFELDGNTGQLALQVCQRLDGIPLAIELAVGKLKVLSLEQVVDRLNDRFHLLTGGSRTALPRQQTLAAAMDWSYELLPEAQRVVLQRLSVFAGGFDLEAAEAVCPQDPDGASEILDVLARLIDKSLLQTVSVRKKVRYQLLETIRQYADRKLAEAKETAKVRDQHRDWFLAFAERAETAMRGPNQVEWYARLEDDLDNIRAVFEWSMEQGQTDAAMRLACALGQFWILEGHLNEGRELFARALGGVVVGAPALRARAAAWAASLANDQSDYENGRMLAEESLTTFRAIGDQQGIGFALLVLGNRSMALDDPKTATRQYAEGLDHFRLAESRIDVAWALNKLGHASWAVGDYDGAIRHLSDGRDLYGELGDQKGVSSALQLLGQVALSKGDLTLASKVLDESLAIFRQVNDVYKVCLGLYLQAVVARYEENYSHASSLLEESISRLYEFGEKQLACYCLQEQGTLASLQGNISDASKVLSQAVTVSFELGDRWCLTKCLEAVGGVCSAKGELLWAAKVLGSAERMRAETGSPMDLYERHAYVAQLSMLQAQLNEADLKHAWEAGKALPVEDIVKSLAELLGRLGLTPDTNEASGKTPTQ